MDEHHRWYNGSVWHIHWPYQVYVGQWPIFYGPAILLHILKTIWWRTVVFGIMDQCDLKIDLVKYNYVGQWPIFHVPLILPYIIVRLKLFLYIKKWHRSGVFMPLWALALVICAPWQCKTLTWAVKVPTIPQPIGAMGTNDWYYTTKRSYRRRHLMNILLGHVHFYFM